MRNRADWGKYSQILLMIVGASVVFAFYARYALYINTVVEVPDEYGYLANAAYFSGTEWASLTNLYYGWGYSLLLLPFFWIGAKGTTIIRGAILINALCTVVTYLIQIGLLSKLCKKLNKYMVVLIAFALSFCPYIMASNTKVLPESLVTLMIWLCGFILCKALETKHVRWYCLLALCMAYAFFVHTRTFVFIGTWIVMLALMAILKEVDWKHFLLFVLLFALFYVVGYEVKYMLIVDVYSNVVGMETSQGITSVGNVLAVETIIAKLKALFTDQILVYLNSFACKFFYAAVATVGTYQLGVYAVVKSCLNKWKQQIPLSTWEWVKVCFVMTSVMMICATAINSSGNLKAVGYFFYSRYYEYTLWPVAALGMEYFIESKKEWKVYAVLIATVVASSVFVFSIYQSLESKVASIDTCRMPAFSALAVDVDYRSMILGYLLITVFALLVGAVLNYKEFARWAFLLLILAGFAFNNIPISSLAINISEDIYPDNIIVDYVLDNVEEEQVYYLDAQYVSYTTRMQALLGIKQLDVIDIEDLGQLSGDYLLVQTGSRYSEELSGFEKVMSGHYYNLYYVE